MPPEYGCSGIHSRVALYFAWEAKARNEVEFTESMLSQII
jgi:hypothetical protein